jgi:26S proteasome regulatory subunit N4
MSKERLNILLSQREALEMEADMIAHNLKSPGPNGEPPAGLKDPLCDSEGFPRGDIDLFEVRAKRHRLAIINTDYRTLMKEIEDEVKMMHAALKNVEEKDSGRAAESKTQQPTTNFHIEDTQIVAAIEVRETKLAKAILIPIATIDEILPESPSAEAGLVDGDMLLSMGNIDYKVSNPMSAIPKLVFDNANSAIPLVIRRGEEVIELSLTPHQWSGRGLLGCHLSPV